MDSSARRLFFAIEVPGPRRKQLLDLFPQKKFHGIRWVEEKNLHITAHFLGWTPPGKLQEMAKLVDKICGNISPFELHLESIKAIKKEKKVVMIWAQFRERKEFELLCQALRAAFPTEEKRKPLPHLTLARIRQLHQLPFEIPETPSFSFQVDAIALWESHLNSAGADYRMIEQWKLKG